MRPPESGPLNLTGDVLSAALTAYLLTHYFSRDRLASIPPDLEFLLYQPLRPREIYGGMTLGLYAYFAVVSAPWLAAVVLLTAPWFGFILVYAFTYVMSADPALFIASSVLRRSRHRDPSAEVRIAAAPIPDPLVQLLLLPVLLSGLVSSAAAAVAVGLIAGGAPAGWFIFAAPASAALSYLLIRPLSEVIADRIAKTDLHF